MPYSAKEDLLVYLEDTVIIGQGLSTNVNLVFYKDFIENQLDIRRTGSLTISLFDAAGKRLLTYMYPDGYGEPITTSAAESTKGRITFTISQFHSTQLAAGSIYIEITFVDSKNFFPSSKTYKFDQFLLGEVTVTGIPTIQEGVSGDVLVSTFGISSITGENPISHGTASFDSSIPSDVSYIILNNTNENHTRITNLESFLTNIVSGAGQEGVITIIDTIRPSQYSIYNIVSWERINLNDNGSNSDLADAIKIYLNYDAATTSNLFNNLNWSIGQRISYKLEAYSNTSDIVSNIENDFTDVRAEINTVDSKINTANNSINSIENQVGSFSIDISSIETALSEQLNTIVASIGTLVENMSQSSSNIITVPFSQINQISLSTSGNYQPTGITITNEPADTTYIEINVNGAIVDVGNGSKINWPCYFSGDGGVTAKEYVNIVIGDELYWNDVYAGYSLEPSDHIDINYQVYATVAIATPFTQTNEIPLATIGNYQPTGITLTYDPIPGTYIEINVNGSTIDVGDGVKNAVPCYFSGDGVNPKSFTNLTIGDQLFWNGNVAGYALSTSDQIDISYQILL